MEVVANKHSKKYPIELNHHDWGNVIRSYVFSLEDAKKLLSDLSEAINEIENEK